MTPSMSLVRLGLANLRFRRLNNALNVLVLALGVALIVTLLHVGTQIQRRFTQDLAGIDLVVGGKGSPLQLILSSVFHLDIPTSNIPLEEARKIERMPQVKEAIPVALGDNFHGFRIVGTTPGYAKHYDAKLAQGAFWTEPMQAVLGSEVARLSGLQIGQPFVGNHGLGAGGEAHTQFPYAVTGILAPTGTVLDRLVLTDLGSVWNVHEHHHHDADDHDDHDEDEEEAKPGQPREITSLLIHYASPYAAVTMPRLINHTSSLQAASPAMEMARLYSLLGIGTDALRIFGGALMAIAAFGFFVTLFQSVQDRRYDIALMRSLGATRGKLCAVLLMEGLVLGSFGAVLGLALGHAGFYVLARWLEASRHVPLASGFEPAELWILAGALLLSLLAAAIPAWMAYRSDVVATLTRGRG